MQVTDAEMLAELDRLREAAQVGPDDPGRTMSEWVAATGWSRGRVNKALWAAKQAGRLSVGKSMRPKLNGAMYPCDVYSIIAGSEKTKGE